MVRRLVNDDARLDDDADPKTDPKRRQRGTSTSSTVTAPSVEDPAATGSAFVMSEDIASECEALSAIYGDEFFRWDEEHSAFELVVEPASTPACDESEQLELMAAAKEARAAAQEALARAAAGESAANKAKRDAASQGTISRAVARATAAAQEAERAVEAVKAADAAAAAAAAPAVKLSALVLRIWPSASYPHAPPRVSVTARRHAGLSDALVSECEALVREAAEGGELLGEVMVHDLAEVVRAWLSEHECEEATDLYSEMVANARREQEAAAKAAAQAAFAAEQVTLHAPSECEIARDDSAAGCCIVCFDDVDVDGGADGGASASSGGLTCNAGHSLCATCVNGHIAARMVGSVELATRGGGMPCLAFGECPTGRCPQAERPTIFTRAQVEPLLEGDALRMYREELEAAAAASDAAAAAAVAAAAGAAAASAERVPPDLYNIRCPSCERFQDPDPDGCIAMVCQSCSEAYCWLCFQPCGRDAHAHCAIVHPPTYFPSRRVVRQWHVRWRWHRVQAHLLANVPEPLRARTLALSEVDLRDVGLWPFPEEAPTVTGDNVPPLIAAAVAGSLEVMQQQLDASVHVDVPDARGMTALMHAGHMGRAEVVAWLIEQGANIYARDNDGNSCLYHALRSQCEELIDLLQEKCPWVYKELLRGAGGRQAAAGILDLRFL